MQSTNNVINENSPKMWWACVISPSRSCTECDAACQMELLTATVLIVI